MRLERESRGHFNEAFGMRAMAYKIHTERNGMGKWRMAGNSLIKFEFYNDYSDFSKENRLKRN